MLRYWSMVVSSLLFVLVQVVQPGQLHQYELPQRSRVLSPAGVYELMERQLDKIKTCGQLDTEATEWINEGDTRLGAYIHNFTTVNWNYLTNLTEYNGNQLAVAQSELDDWTFDMLPTARRYLNNVEEICNPKTARMLERFVNGNLLPVAKNPDTRKRVSALVTSLEEIYSTATVTDAAGQKYNLDPELTELFTTSRDYDKLKWAWEAWHNATGPRMKSMYAQLVNGMNEGARDNGFKDVGIAWQVVDFERPNVEVMMDRLYAQLKPFYKQLHAYVRRKLILAYPNHNIDPRGPMPAHLFGDMWAQTWGNIIDLLMPYPNRESPDVTRVLRKANFTVNRMFRTAEEFYTSIGLDPMTDDFWSKSVLVRPSDNTPMVCHGSADDFYTQTDFRIKMCTVVSQSDFDTVHHEMGHIQYFMEYRNQPNIFRTGANAAFHEAIGDTISLSVTSVNHLRTIGLISASPETGTSSQDAQEDEINFLMKMALNKIAFIPFAYIMDKWRYRVFRGDVRPEQYNIDWWKLRRRYQGLKAPSVRPIDLFDPGSKYHIPANVPYSRYFFSFISQFQFHSSLCRLAGHTGPLHTCDIYRSKAAGNKLKSVLSLGSSWPWPEAMYIFTGQRDFSVDAMLEYFKPLVNWLKEENKNIPVGW